MNTYFMSREEYPADTERIKLLEKANNVFTIVFIVEMALKIIGKALISIRVVGVNKIDVNPSLLSLQNISSKNEGKKG